MSCSVYAASLARGHALAGPGPRCLPRPCRPCRAVVGKKEAWADKALDDEFSRRDISLDPAGYFVIRVEKSDRLIVADFFTNVINKNGVACDPETGKPIPCSGGVRREPTATYRARTAKEMQVLLEADMAKRVSKLDHAMYLGREFARAEISLLDGSYDYIQD